MLVVVASRNRNGGQSIVFAEKQGWHGCLGIMVAHVGPGTWKEVGYN